MVFQYPRQVLLKLSQESPVVKAIIFKSADHDRVYGRVYQDLFLYMDVLVYVEGVIYSMDEENERATQAGVASLKIPLQGLSKGLDQAAVGYDNLMHAP